MSFKSQVAGKDVYLYAGVMTEALKAVTYCPLTLRRPSATKVFQEATPEPFLNCYKAIKDQGPHAYRSVQLSH